MRPCAMITNISISRGIGNLGYDEHWNALAIDVTIDVTDLAPVLAVPAMPGLLSPGHPMTNYIWALSSVEMDMYLHGLTQISKNIERVTRATNSLFDKANIANNVAQFFKGTPLRYIVSPGYAFNLAGGEYMDSIDPVR